MDQSFTSTSPAASVGDAYSAPRIGGDPKAEQRTHHLLTGGVTIDSSLHLHARSSNFGRRRASASGTNQKVKIDYLSISLKLILRRIHQIFGVLLPEVVISDKAFGWNGYPRSASLTYRGVPVGMLAWGAKHERNFISFSGAGCSRIDDWSVFQYVLERRGARLTRIDLAFDVYHGEITYEDVEAAAFPDNQDTAGGEFVNPRGGPKSLSFKRCASGGKFGNEGRTLYIGGTNSSKQICIYEKGHEVYGKLPAIWAQEKLDPANAVFEDDRYGCPGGTEVTKWLRLEVRYSNSDRVLALAMLVQPDRYFAGAYPFCARVLKRGDGIAPSTVMTNAEVTLEKMIHYAKISYGPVLHILHSMSHLTKEEVFDRIVREKVSPRLRSSGIFADLPRAFAPHATTNEPTKKESE